MATHARAIHTSNVTTIAVAHSISTLSLLLATDHARAGGLHLGSPHSAAIEQQQRCDGQGWPSPVECTCIMGTYVGRGLGVWKSWLASADEVF